MATLNPFDLLGDDDNDDPSQLIAAAQQQKAAAAATAPPASGGKKAPTASAAAKMPTKPLPPSQAGNTFVRSLVECVLILFCLYYWFVDDSSKVGTFINI